MRALPLHRTLLICCGAFVCAFAVANAQLPAAPNPPVSTPTPAPVAIPGDSPSASPPYPLDLPELKRPDDNGLFPSGQRQSPPPPGSPRSNGRGSQRSKFTGGTKQRGRSLDRILQNADADPLDIRVAYRRAKTEAIARDPELGELGREAEMARTDAAKRVCLRQYYSRLFASVRHIDPSPAMKAHVDLLSQVAAQRYDPTRRTTAGEEDLLNGRDTGRGWLGR